MDKMGNKYYTPDVSDFYIGYEFEANADNGYGDHWIKFTYSQPSWVPFDSEKYILGDDSEERKLTGGINPKKIRTKYLDRLDIESLGWKFSEAIGKYLWFGKDDWYLSFNPDNQWVEISEDGYDHGCFMRCKSINEFRKLEDWLGAKTKVV